MSRHLMIMLSNQDLGSVHITANSKLTWMDSLH